MACEPLKIITKSSEKFCLNKHSHPFIYMRGLKVKDFVALLDFIIMYLGKANIYHEDPNGFLTIAEEMKLKGLSGHQTNIANVKSQYHKAPKKNSD